MLKLYKPTKTVVPVAVGLAWTDDGSLYQEKLDGRFKPIEFPGGNMLACELLRDSHSVAFDCVQFDGRDVRTVPLTERLHMRSELCRRYSVPELPAFKNGGKLLAEVLARGGEGVVRKQPDAKWWYMMEAAKRLETFYCVVTGFCGGTQSVEIGILHHGDTETLSKESALCLCAAVVKPCGRVPLRSGKCEQVRIGSILKVVGTGLTDDGKIREPRVCNDSPTSWLVKY